MNIDEIEDIIDTLVNINQTLDDIQDEDVFQKDKGLMTYLGDAMAALDNIIDELDCTKKDA